MTEPSMTTTYKATREALLDLYVAAYGKIAADDEVMKQARAAIAYGELLPPLMSVNVPTCQTLGFNPILGSKHD